MTAKLQRNMESSAVYSFNKEFTLERYAEKLNKFFDDAYLAMQKSRST